MLRNDDRMVSTGYVTDIYGNLDQFNGVTQVAVKDGFLIIDDEKGGMTIVPAQRIKDAVFTPGRD